MTYQVKFTETTNPAKPSIIVEDQAVENQSTSLTFVGKNYAGYATPMAENFLHLLENFASPFTAPPAHPVQGQLWYDNTNNLLKVFDGTTWTAAGSVKKSGDQPTIGAAGDLWVDTINQQLYLYSGSNWLLIGPQFSSGLKTGPDIETITDTNNVDHNVITMWSENYRIAIVSKAAFTPKQTLSGFTSINQGINLSSIDETSSSAPTRFHGIATKADALVINSKTIDASNFLRSDVISTTNYPINIRNNGGLSIGSDLGFNVSTDSGVTILYSKTAGNSIDFKVNSANAVGFENGTPITILHLDANSNVGIGPNNTNPQEALDVNGNIISSGKVIVTDVTDATVLGGESSITTSGGLNVDKQARFGGDVTTYSTITLNNLDVLDNPIETSVILPGASLKYDIGSSNYRFKNVWAESFVGNFTGTLTTTNLINGSINGSAAKLSSPTVFSISGDIASSNTITFDGQGDSPAVFTTVLSQDVIHNKADATDSVDVPNSLPTDELLIYRDGVGLRKTTKQTIVSNIATVPVGSIFPFAGSTVPTGYLLCDGGEVRVGDYSVLFSIIGYTYKAIGSLIGKNTFALPDLRGRFPLGRDNMDNGNTVPDKNQETILVNAGGGSANRVVDVVADILGAGTDIGEYRTIATTNLPDHRHTLATSGADYFAVGRPGATSDSQGLTDTGPAVSTAGLAVPNTGGVLGSSTGTALPTMNPYLTINYIIFTGVL